MEFAFDCSCGDDVSGFTRGEKEEANFHVSCEGCGAVYAVTVTRIKPAE